MCLVATTTSPTEKKAQTPTLSSHPGREMSEPSRGSPTFLLFSKTLLVVFVLSLAVWTPQTSESQRTDPPIFSSIMVPDFTIGATLPSVAPADGTSLATSTIIVNPIEHFTGNITLSDLPPSSRPRMYTHSPRHDLKQLASGDTLLQLHRGRNLRGDNHRNVWQNQP